MTPFKTDKPSFSRIMERNSLFIAILIASIVVSCSIMIVKHNEKTKRVDKKIELKVLSHEGKKPKI